MSPAGPAASVVAIDGPSGVGKGTVARRVARRLDLPYLDTGAMYRTVAWRALEEGVDVDDRREVATFVRGLDLRLVEGGATEVAIVVEGEVAGSEIRSQAVGEAASRVAAIPAVRELLVGLQRDFGRRHGAVLEGRDIGTVVFPETPHKFFLDADLDVRVRRRVEQLEDRGESPDREEVAMEMKRRDDRDRTREISPLICDQSYTRVDTGEMTIDEVVELLVAEVGAGSRGER